MPENKSDAAHSILPFILIAIAFIVVRIPSLALVDISWSDVNLYRLWAEKLHAGAPPYSGFPYEYPPLTILLWVIPAFVSKLGVSFEVAFRALMALFDVGCLLLVYFISRELFPGQRQKAHSAIGLYLALSAISFQLIYDRLDIAVAFYMLLAVFLALKARWAWAYIAVILGVFTKLTPAILLPLIAIYQFRTQRKLAGIVRDLGATVICGVILLIVTAVIFGDWWSYMLQYHGRRGIQIETLYASIVMIANMLGIKATVGHQYGAFQISSPFTEILAMVSPALVAVSILGIYTAFFMAVKGKREGDYRLNFITASLLTLTAFVIFNKVFSPQFILWLIPFAAIAIICSPNMTWEMSLWILAVVGTTIIFPYQYKELVRLENVPVTILFLRNACLFIIAASGLFALLRSRLNIQK
jgi:hypothetical protein